jgi:predicted nuclease with TOPRIM domain
MVAGAKGRAGKPAARRRSGAGTAQNDAEEAMQDAVAELNDTTVALDGAGESEAPALPDGLLQRRLDKATQEKAAITADKQKLLKEKELLQKQMDEMKAQLELAKAKVGDVVSVTTPARKVCRKAYSIHRLML